MEKSIQETCAELDKQVVAQICGRAVTRAELSQAFDRVCRKDNWKMPIDCTIEIGSDVEKLVVAEAVVFFTGSRARFEILRVVHKVGTPGHEKGLALYRVQAEGYYRAVGA